MRVCNTLVIGCICLGLTRCASLSSFQTAKTLPEGQATHTVAAGYVAGKVSDQNVGLPTLEYMYRRGLTEKLESGVKYTLPVTIVADIKYNLFRNDGAEAEAVTPFALAAGLGLGYLQIRSGDQETSLIDIYVPVYLSYHLSKSFSAYLTPKYLLRVTSGAMATAASFFAPSVGVRIGDKMGVMLEAGYGLPFSGGQGMAQGSVAFFFPY